MQREGKEIEIEPLIGVDEASRLLHISPKAVYQLSQQGRIASVRISRRCVRWRRVDIEAFIKSHIQGSGDGTNG
jgi:excisionase family DNA binding protein